jgi:hypothetical protein
MELFRAFNLMGLAPTSDLVAIKKAYRRRAMELHPDRAAPGTPPEAFLELDKAWKMFQEVDAHGLLSSVVAGLLKEYTTGPDVVEVPQEAPDSIGAGSSVAATFPNMSRQVIVEYLGAGRFAVWVYGRMYRTNQSARGAAAVLRGSIGPQFRGDRDAIEVWLFSPNAIKRRTLLGMLEEELEDLSATAEALRARRARVGTPASPRPSSAEQPEPDEELREAMRGQDWRGAYSGYVISTDTTKTTLFRVERVRGRVDFRFVGAYEGSAAALQHLNRLNLSPDITPVWFRHAGMGSEINRLGAA